MSQHTPPSRLARHQRPRPRGRAKLVALEVAIDLVAAINTMRFQRGLSHLRDHLVRAADNTEGKVGWCSVGDLVSLNTALRLAEASGRTMGNRYQHLEAAYAENQEVQTDLRLLQAHGLIVPTNVHRQADRLGGLIYGLLKAES